MSKEKPTDCAPLKLKVNEIFLSLQGESSFAGLPCLFIRLTGCNLRCSYCDTAYAFTEGESFSLEAIQEKVLETAKPFGSPANGRRLPLVELTGGEPLLQSAAFPLMRWLCDQGFTVLVETSGAVDISRVDERVHRIMDLKCPSSGEVERNLWSNLDVLKSTDELKFVIGSHEDYAWAKEILFQRRLHLLCPILFSCAAPLGKGACSNLLKSMPAGQHPLPRRELAERVIQDALPVRFQIQLHKEIWPPDARGV